jgi:3-oxoacyl-[acyl-carrier protein] reductase
MDFKGKVALVTGGGRDIGREVCKKLSSLGAKVCLNYYDSDNQGDETVEFIKKNGGVAMLVQSYIVYGETEIVGLKIKNNFNGSVCLLDFLLYRQWSYDCFCTPKQLPV